MHAPARPGTGNATGLPDVPIARPEPITDEILGQMIAEARAAELNASYDVTGMHIRLMIMPCLEELAARRRAMALAANPRGDVVALTRAGTPGTGPEGGAPC